jgi:DNA-binding transcriptional LysR family regulator
MRMTAAGEAVLASVQRHFVGLTAIERTIRDIRDSVRGVLGAITIPALAEGALGRLLGQFAREHPDVSVKLAVGHEERVLSGVLSHEFDFGAVIGALPPRTDLAALPIGPRRVTLVLPADHRLAVRDRVHVLDLDGEDVVQMPAPHYLRAAFEIMLPKFGVRPRRVHEAPTQRAVAALAQHGGMIGIVDSEVADSVAATGLRSVALEPEACWTANLIYWPRHDRSAVREAFLLWLKRGGIGDLRGASAAALADANPAGGTAEVPRSHQSAVPMR